VAATCMWTPLSGCLTCRWLVYHGFADAGAFGSEVVEWGGELVADGSGKRQMRLISSHPALFLIEKRARKPIAT
jgi:hypothetical protein